MAAKCPHCEKMWYIDPKYYGREVICTKCKNTFVEKQYDLNSDNSGKSADDVKKSARDAFNSLFS